MPIEVDTPDGVAEFPDGTPDDVIERALKEAYPAAAPAASVTPNTAVGVNKATVAPPAAEVNLDDPETRARAISAVTGLPNSEVAGGVMKGVLSTAREIGRHVPGGSLLDAAGVYDKVVPEVPAPANPTQKAGQALEQAGEFFIPGPAGKTRMLRAALEAVKGGGLTALHGGTPQEVGLNTALGGVIPAAGGAVADLAARVAKRRSVVSILRALGVRPRSEPGVEEIAGNLVGEGGIGIGSRARLQTRSAARRAEAGKAIEALQESDVPVDVAPAAKNLAEQAGKESLALPAAELPADFATLPGPQRTAALKRLESASDGPTSISGDPALASELGARTKELEALAQANPEGARAGDLFRLREQYGKSATRTGTYERLPGMPGSAEGESRAAAQSALSNVLHEAIPESRAADEAYKTWARADNALKTALQGQLSRQTIDRFIASAAGRIGMNALVATGGGAVNSMMGGNWGEGAVGAAIVYNMGRSAFWNSLSAQTMARIASAIESGADDVALKLITNAVQANVARDSTANPDITVTARARRELERQRRAASSGID